MNDLQLSISGDVDSGFQGQWLGSESLLPGGLQVWRVQEAWHVGLQITREICIPSWISPG